jgi:MoxR-like ATPase
MPKLFMVLATQNPIEQEGTYNLPEAQLDRFLMHVRVDYPTREEELAILELDSNLQVTAPEPPAEVFSQEQLFEVREDAAKLFLAPKLNNYIVDLVQASRNPEAYDEGLKRWCRFGASPRATIALARCARARAWLDGEEFVTPDHIQAVAPDVMRHRVMLTFEGEAEGVTSDDYIRRLLEVVAIP